MKLTNEKAKVISDFLLADKERAQHLLELDPETAAREMHVAGCNVEADELVEFGAAMVSNTENEALSEEDLDNVSGGVLPVVAVVAIACGSALGAGIIVGRLEKKW